MQPASRAILLGLLQGPTEMAPISSSAHTSLLRAALRWDGEDAALAKSLEVALHGGGALALGIAMAGRLRRGWERLGNDAPAQGRQASGGRRLKILALSLAPPAVTGYLLERPIERRLGGPKASAAGLALGAVAMAIAERRPQERALEQADARDGLSLGIAQAAALMPGVSRRGATLTAARLRGMSRQDADELSWLTALPVIAGACALKAARLREASRTGEAAEGEGETAGEAREAAGQLLAGAVASLLATLLAARALSGLGRISLLWFAAYRVALAILIAMSMRDDRP